MTPKTSIGRFLRQRHCHFTRTRNWLLGASVFVLIGTQASAFTAYVSNEKSNTVSVIDTDKFTVVNTIKVGQRPRGIELTKDGKFVLVAVGDDDTIQVIDVRTHEIVATLPSGPDPELFTQDHTGKILYVANEYDQYGAFHRHRDAPDRRQRVGRCTAPVRGVQARRLRGLGFVRNRWHRERHRSRET